MNTTITLLNSSNNELVYTSDAEINKWKTDISKKLKKIKYIEKRYKDEIDRSSIKAYDLEKLCRSLYKNITDFEVEDEKMLKDVMETIKQVYGDSLSETCLKMYENDLSRIFYNIRNSSDEKSLKMYNDAISKIIHDVQKDSDEYIKSCNQKIVALKDQEKKIKYDLSLVTTSPEDVSNNIYMFIQNAISNISDCFAEYFIVTIYNEIMDKQSSNKYETTISSSVNQYVSKTMLKKMNENVFKVYEERLKTFASEYFRISHEDMYTIQCDLRRIINDFETAFKEGMCDWLVYCTNSDKISDFTSSVIAKSMTMARMQTYNQRIENSGTLLIMKYLRNANELINIVTWFEEELNSIPINEPKKTIIRVEEMDDDEVPKPKVEKTIENFAKELGTRTLTSDELTDVYNQFFGTNLSKVGVGRKISGNNLFVKDVKNRVTVYYVNKI